MKYLLQIASFIAAINIVYCEDNQKKNQFQPLPPGSYFSITNNNSQNFNLEEKRSEVTMSVQQPPVVIHTQPPQPAQQPPQHRQRAPQHNSFQNNQFLDEPDENYHLIQKSEDYFGYYCTKLKDASSLFTAKNCLIALGVAASSYTGIYFMLLYHVKNAQKTTGWGSFQEHIPPADLKSLDLLALADGIVEEIKARYPLINPNNLMPSLLLFNRDIEQELDELNNFINFYKGIITYKLSALFPNQEKLMVKAHTKIHRLHIIRDAITEWINTHVTRLMRNQPIPRHNGGIETINEKCIAFLVHE